MEVKSASNIRPGVKKQDPFPPRPRPVSQPTPPTPAVQNRPSRDQEIEAEVRRRLEEAQKRAGVSASAIVSGITSHEGRTSTVPEDVPLSSSWERVNLPSNFVFYEWKDISLKHFRPSDHAKLSRAVRHRNVSLLLDVLSSCADRDVRDLAYVDFQAVCLWHKLNSYLNTPYRIRWMSRYGTEATASTTKIFLREKYLEVSREDYLKWVAQGIVTNTCRDMELIDSGMEEDELILYERAQYIDPRPLAERIAQLKAKGDPRPSATARIEELDRRGMDMYNKLNEFVEQFSDFGIRELLKVKMDPKDFDAEKAVAALTSFVGTDEEVAEALREAEEIRTAVAAGVSYEPKEEEVPVVFNPWTMFPHV